MSFMKNNLKRVILTGFRATGKSVVGAKLARMMSWNFVDSDQLVEELTGSSISEVVRLSGWDFFRQQEEKVLQSLLEKENIVVATGGGAILHSSLWQDLRKDSVVIWLQADLETIVNRLSLDGNSKKQRPPLTGNDIAEEVREMLLQREPLYRAGSDFTFITSRQTVYELARKIYKTVSVDL